MTQRMVIRRGSDLGAAMAEARTARGLSQEQVAELTGLDRTYLAKVEAGNTTLLLERAIRTLRRLGAEVYVELPDR